jgi:hypothetical protein
VAWGDFALPDSLTNGNYRVRAYTQLMRNDEGSGFFEQNIPVVAVVKSKIKSNTTLTQITGKSSKPDIQFFPEGGTLVNGIASKIAFKVIAPNGLSIGASGQVIDNENQTVCTFKTAHLGMGYFYLTPQPGESYKAKLSYADGTQDEVDLPKADEDGITISVSNNDSTIIAPVAISAGKNYFAGNKGKNYILSVYSGGKLTNITCALDSELVTLDIFKRKLPSGITRLTLFSPKGEPLCERLLFIQNNDKLKLSLNSDKTLYATREKVNIKLNASDSKSLPVSGDFSVSVTNESAVPVDTNKESTILNNLLLTSDLKGNVEQPNYYFNNTPDAYNNLDILMLTQGYRGFVWKKVLTDTTTIARYLPETSLSITGTVKTQGGKMVPNDDINLVSTKPYIAKDTLSDAAGNFRFNDINVFDTVKLVLRAKGNRLISVQEPIDPAITNTVIVDTSNSQITPALATEMAKRYEQQGGNMKKGILLKQVNIHGKKGEYHFTPKLTHSDNLNGPGRADQVIMGDQLVGCTDVAQCLQSLIHGARFSGTGGFNSPPIIYSLRTPIALTGPTKPMIVILNGVLMEQTDVDPPLLSINANDIYSVEVLENPAYLGIYGEKASGGAIVITLRNGSERRAVNMQPGLTTYEFHGFYKTNEFYSPKYEVPTHAGSSPDYRTTVFWNPVLISDKDGNASFNFYNSDAPGNYRVVVEGIDGNGNLGRVVYRYRVE